MNMNAWLTKQLSRALVNLPVKVPVYYRYRNARGRIYLNYIRIIFSYVRASESDGPSNLLIYPLFSLKRWKVEDWKSMVYFQFFLFFTQPKTFQFLFLRESEKKKLTKPSWKADQWASRSTVILMVMGWWWRTTEGKRQRSPKGMDTYTKGRGIQLLLVYYVLWLIVCCLVAMKWSYFTPRAFFLK